MNEIKDFRPTRIDLNFIDLHHEQGDENYEINFSRLFVNIYGLCERVFSAPRRDGRMKKAAWLYEYSQSFYKYTETLARPDPNTGYWGRLLRDEKERSFLLAAMIMKVLDTNVFSSLLFGADFDQAKILQSADEQYVQAEGFIRHSIRAQLNCLYLKRKDQGVPPIFWEEVDRVTIQLVSLLLPVYAYTAESTDSVLPSIQRLYQDLHDVVAHAGWLSVSIRLSPNIVVMEWTSPGERARTEDVNLSQDVYNYSAVKAERSAGAASRQFGLQWTARVKISVAPKIIRHTQALDGDGVPSTQGIASYTVMKPHVVYYSGCHSEEDERALYMSLPIYIVRLRAHKKEPPYSAALIIILLVVLAAWYFYQALWELVRPWVVQWMS